MKPIANPFRRSAISGIFTSTRLTFAVSAAIVSTSWAVNDRFWDSDVANDGGSAGNTAVGTWGTDAFWNDDANGAAAGNFISVTDNTQDLHFSAGTDVTSTTNYIVTVSGAQSANSIIFEEGGVTLSGGTSITLGGGSGANVGLFFNNGTVANIISTPLILGQDAIFSHADNSAETISGGVTGTASLTLNANSTGALTLSTNAVNPTGALTISGTGTGITTLSGGVGSNVTNILASAIGNTSFGTAGTHPIVNSGNITVSSAGVSNTAVFPGLVNHTGTILNNGTSTGSTSFTGGIGASVGNITQSSAGAFTISGNAWTLGGDRTLTSTSTTTTTLSGGTAGTGNLTLNANNTGALTISTLALNHTGLLTLSGTGTGVNTLSAAIGGNVGNILFNSAGNLTFSSPTVANTGNLVFSNTGTSVTTASAANINNAGSISNTGTTTGTTAINGIIGSAVTGGVVQNSASSQLTLSGTNTFTGPVTIKAGILLGNTGLTPFGSSVTPGAITIGDSAVNLAATLSATLPNTSPVNNPIILASGVSAPLTITGGTSGSQGVFTGGVTGTNDLVLAVTGGATTGGIRFTNANAVNNAGSITATNGNSNPTITIELLGSNVTSITQAGNSKLVIASPLVLNATNKTLISTGSGLFTFSGGITGPQDLTINANSTGGITLSTTLVDNAGSVTVSGSGGGVTNISAGLGTNVTGLSNSALSATTVGAFSLGGNRGIVSTSGALLTVGAITSPGPANLLLNANGVGGITIASANHAGSITNSGGGTNTVTINGVIGSNVGAITQNSQTSLLVFNGVNTFTGSFYIQSGSVRGSSSASAFGAGTIRLGDDSPAGPGNTASATLIGNVGATFTNNIVLGNTSGTLTIGSPNTGSTQGFNGDITGNNSFVINANGPTGTAGITFSNSASKQINNVGTITNVSTAAGPISISQKIGSNVTGVFQDVSSSTAGNLVLSGTANTFQNGVTIRRGTVSTNVNGLTGGFGAFGPAANIITLGDPAGAVGTFNDATLLLTAASANVVNPITLAANAAGALTLASNSTSATGVSFNSAITLNGKNLNLAHNAVAPTAFITLGGSFTGTGTLTNAGTGTGFVNVTATIGSNVTSVTQNSVTSPLVLSANNSFTGGLFINAGSVEGRQTTGITTSLGGGSVTLGSNTTGNATLLAQGANAIYANPVVLGTTSGLLTIGNSNTLVPVAFTGGVTGPNNVTLSSGIGVAGTSTLTFSGASLDNLGTITNGTVSGNNEIFISSVIGTNVTGVIQNSATAGLTLQGGNIYTGPTTVTAGTLTLGSGGSLAGTAVTTNGGTFRATGTNTIGTSGSPSLNIGDGTTLSLVGGGINTLAVNSATSGASVLNFTGATGGNLNLDVLGTTADAVNLGGGLMASIVGTVTVNPNLLGSVSSGSRTIISAPGGGLTTGGGFALNAVSGNFGGNTLSLTPTPTSLILNVTAAASQPLLYFTGSIDGSFNSFTGGNTNNSNFSALADGSSDAFAGPDSTTEVHIQSTSLPSVIRTVTLGRDFTIKSLFIDSQVANALTLASGVGSSSLTITPTVSTDGITVNSSAGGSVTISAPVILGATQTFANNTANTTTISGAITSLGSADLILKSNGNTATNNAGLITLSGGVNHAGSITNSGTGTVTTPAVTNGVTINSVVGSNVTAITQNSATTGMTLSGAVANSSTGPVTVSAGNLTLAKTGGAVAAGGNVLINGGNLVYGNTGSQIADTATVTLTSGQFNSTGLVNTNSLSINQTIAALSVSGSGIYNNGSGATGVVVTGATIFTGGSGAAYFAGSGSQFTTNSLTLTGMNGLGAGGTGGFSNAQVANSFTVFGNSGTVSQVIVGTGGLTLNGSNINLRRGTSGSRVMLDGDVTTAGTTLSQIREDTSSGSSTGSLSIGLAATALGPVTRTFNIAGGGADLTTGGAVSITNGSSSAASLTKTGAGTLRVNGAGTYTGATIVDAGKLLLVSGAINSTASVEIGGAGSGIIELGAAERVSDSAPVLLVGGGRINTGGFSENLGTLQLTGSGNTLDLGSGTSTVDFDNSNAVAWSAASVNILNWTGNSGGGGTDRVFFGINASGLTGSQLAAISFIDPSVNGTVQIGTFGATILASGEIVPSTPPSGAYGTWANANITNPADRDALDDGDFDGLANLIEYAFDTDPEVSNGSVVSIGSQDPYTLSFNRASGRTDITLTVKSSPDLAAGNWTTIATSTGGGALVSNFGGDIAIVDPNNASGGSAVTVTDNRAPEPERIFYRVEVSQP